MLFYSFTFLFLLTLVLVLDRTLPSPRSKKIMILSASVVFYAAWKPIFVPLMTFQALVDWYAARAIAGTVNPRKRRAWLITSIGINLSVLAFFKYMAFFATSINDVSVALGSDYQLVVPHVLLPIGISFYTFETISYTIDVYRRQLKPTSSFLDYSVFITFFPHLVAGPIVRASAFLPQCVDKDGIRATRRRLGYGLALFAIGLFQKLIIADGIFARLVDAIYAAPGNASTADAWLGAVSFSGQIYYDFSGYSTCAVGLAACLGITIADNFHSPYAALGFSEFWRRWHISLSSWLRDYLWVPLSVASPARPLMVLVVTMVLGGLWHGAAWTFVVWGLLHGFLLVIERGVRKLLDLLKLSLTGVAWTAIGIALTFISVCATWVIFRAQTLHDAATVLKRMFFIGSGDGIALRPYRGQDVTLALIAVVLMLATHVYWRRGRFDRWMDQSPWWARAAILSVVLTIVALSIAGGTTQRAFIYFQF